MNGSLTYDLTLSLLGLLLAVGLLLPRIAETKVTLSTFADGQVGFSADFDVITRYEAWNWFAPDAPGSVNSDYDYFFTRSRIGISLKTQYLNAYVQGQNTLMFGLPGNSLAPAPAGPLGIGAIYYLHGHDQNYGSTIIRQAYLELPDIGGSRISLKGGRFDYIDGKEVMYKDKKVNWLKNIRLAERLIGPFGWAAFCRSFDGMQMAYENNRFNLTAMASHPTQGGFEADAHDTIGEIDLATITATLKYNILIPNLESRFFYFYYDDDRAVPKVDNTPAGSLLNHGAITIHTLGMHLLTTRKTANGISDGLLWAVYQTGDWGTLDHQAWALDIEVGYQFTGIPWKPWLRIGYAISSGDDDPTDGDHETFFQLLPTARKYALFPFYNLMNNEDLFVQMIVKPHKKLVIRADLHLLSLTESNDRWYMGAGATREEGTIFGYIGRPSFGDDDLATVFELTAMANLTKNLSATVYYGHAFGDDVIENIYTQDEDGDFFYLELKLTF